MQRAFFALVLMTACGDDGATAMPDAAPSGCPISTKAVPLIEEIVTESVMHGGHVTEYSHDMERGFAWTLVGREEGYIGFLTLAFPCTGPETFDVYCEYAMLPPGEADEPFWEDHDKCLRLGCDAADVGWAEVYFTARPTADPLAPHRFEYELTSIDASAVADPNPVVRWTADTTDPAAIEVSADLDLALTVTPAGGDPIVLDHAGRIEVAKADLEIDAISVELTFAGLGVTASVMMTSPDVATGSITLRGATLATVSGDLVFTWAEGCAP